MRIVNILAALIIAPLLGMCLNLKGFTASAERLLLPVEDTSYSLDACQQTVDELENRFNVFYQEAHQQKSQFEEQEQVLASLAQTASKQERNRIKFMKTGSSGCSVSRLKYINPNGWK